MFYASSMTCEHNPSNSYKSTTRIFHSMLLSLNAFTEYYSCVTNRLPPITQWQWQGLILPPPCPFTFFYLFVFNKVGMQIQNIVANMKSHVDNHMFSRSFLRLITCAQIPPSWAGLYCKFSKAYSSSSSSQSTLSLLSSS